MPPTSSENAAEFVPVPALDSPDLPRRLARAYALAAMIASSVLFALMSATIKWLSHPLAGTPNLPAGEVALVRYLCGLTFLFTVAAVRNVSLLGEDRKRLLWRGIYGGFASTFFFLGIQRTTLTNATLLNYTFVVWAPLMAVFALRERLGKHGVVALLLALCGVALVTRPEFGQFRQGDAIALFSGVMAGAAVVQVRQLRKGESSLAIFFYFNLIGVPISLTTIPMTHAPFVWPALSQLPLLLAVGVTSVGGQLLMTYGYKEMTTAQGSLITLTTVLYAALLAFFFFHDPLTVATLFGGALIVFASALTIRPAAYSAS